ERRAGADALRRTVDDRVQHLAQGRPRCRAAAPGRGLRTAGVSVYTATVITPEPPGRIGATISPEDALHYLEALSAWRDGRRAELEGVDAGALKSSARRYW